MARVLPFAGAVVAALAAAHGAPAATLPPPGFGTAGTMGQRPDQPFVERAPFPTKAPAPSEPEEPIVQPVSPADEASEPAPTTPSEEVVTPTAPEATPPVADAQPPPVEPLAPATSSGVDDAPAPAAADTASLPADEAAAGEARSPAQAPPATPPVAHVDQPVANSTPAPAPAPAPSITLVIPQQPASAPTPGAATPPPEVTGSPRELVFDPIFPPAPAADRSAVPAAPEASAAETRRTVPAPAPVAAPAPVPTSADETSPFVVPDTSTVTPGIDAGYGYGRTARASGTVHGARESSETDPLPVAPELPEGPGQPFGFSPGFSGSGGTTALLTLGLAVVLLGLAPPGWIRRLGAHAAVLRERALPAPLPRPG